MSIIKSNLEKGRPSDMNGRQDKEKKVYDFLDSLGIEYQRIDHEKADTMDACTEIGMALGTEICKNLFLCNRQKTDFYLLLMPGSKPFKTKELSGQIGVSRLSFASPEDMEKFLNTSPGSVSIMGLMNDTGKKVTLLIDDDILKDEFIGCHPCVNTSSIKIRTDDIINKFLSKTGHYVNPVKLIGE